MQVKEPGKRTDNKEVKGPSSAALGPWETLHMPNPFSSFCDDFYINMRLGSQLALPHNRETILHFFETLQKAFPGMTRFRKNDNNDLNLEEDRGQQSYRWAGIESKRLSSGYVNPPDIAEAMNLHTFLLELAP